MNSKINSIEQKSWKAPGGYPTYFLQDSIFIIFLNLYECIYKHKRTKKINKYIHINL